MKITVDNLGSKLGKRINYKTVEELNLSNLQIDDIGSFSKCEVLLRVDLSGNWMRFTRQLVKLLDAPMIQEIDFTGNSVCKVPHYRGFVISHKPSLLVLDKIKITQEEREEAVRLFMSAEGELVDEPTSDPVADKKKEDEEISKKNKFQQEQDQLKREKDERSQEKESQKLTRQNDDDKARQESVEFSKKLALKMADEDRKIKEQIERDRAEQERLLQEQSVENLKKKKDSPKKKDDDQTKKEDEEKKKKEEEKKKKKEKEKERFTKEERR